MKPYTDYNYAMTRIRGTIVMDGTLPVEVVSGVLSAMDVEVYEKQYNCPNKYKEECKVPVLVKDIKHSADKGNYISCVSKLIPSLPELGYVNYKGKAVYISRVPKRRDWRQGLRYHNMKSLSYKLPINNIPYSLISDCLMDVYPSFRRCIESFKRSRTLRSIAWCKDWALCRDNVVLYQDIAVGELLEGRISLRQEHQYLQEALDESTQG